VNTDIVQLSLFYDANYVVNTATYVIIIYFHCCYCKYLDVNIANTGQQQMTKLLLQTNPSNNTTIPNAQSVYVSQSITLLTSVGTFGI
jgi:hypothetical protein